MKNRSATMSGLKDSLKKNVSEMHWGDIDRIIWSWVQDWDGKKKSREKLEKNVAKFFNWNDKQAKVACEMHFRVYKKHKIE